MHQNMWHRGTQELVGKRRIMLKVIYDRTTEPSTPSWNHQAKPVWSQEILDNSPWIPHTWNWMAGLASSAPLDRTDSLSDQQTADLMMRLNSVVEDEPAALRSAHILGSKGDVRVEFRSLLNESRIFVCLRRCVSFANRLSLSTTYLVVWSS